MSKYLFILNWLMAAALLSSWLFLKPVFGLAVFIGAALGGMLSVGFVSWQYHKDINPDKASAWLIDYFHKDYKVEIPVQMFLSALFLSLSFLFWRPFFSLLGGFALMWCVNIFIEALWSIVFVKRQL